MTEEPYPPDPAHKDNNKPAASWDGKWGTRKEAEGHVRWRRVEILHLLKQTQNDKKENHTKTLDKIAPIL